MSELRAIREAANLVCEVAGAATWQGCNHLSGACRHTGSQDEDASEVPAFDAFFVSDSRRQATKLHCLRLAQISQVNQSARAKADLTVLPAVLLCSAGTLCNRRISSR